MKKSFFRVLTFALALCSVGLISSCKDYEEDLRTEFDAKLSNLDISLNAKVDQQIANLTNKLTALEQQLAEVKNCNCGIDKPWASDISNAVQDAINKVEKELDEKADEAQIRSTITEILTKELGNYCSKADIDKLIEDKLKNLGNCACDLDVLKKEIAGMIQTTITSTVTKEYIEKLIGGDYANKAEFEALKAKVDELTLMGATVSELAQTVAKLKSDLEGANKTIKEHGDDISALYKLYEQLNSALTELKGRVDLIESNFNAVKAAAEDAKNKAAEAISKAEEALEIVKNITPGSSDPGLEARVIILEKFKEKWENTLKAWESTIANLNMKYNELKTVQTQLQNEVNDLKTELAKLQDDLTQGLKEAKDKAQEAFDKASDNANKITTLENNYTTLLGELNAAKDRITQNEKDIDKAEEDINKNKEDINKNKEDIEKANDRIALTEADITELETKLTNALTDIQKNKEDIAQLQIDCAKNLTEAKAYTDNQIAIVNAALAEKASKKELEDAIKDLKDAVEAADKALNDRLAVLEAIDHTKFALKTDLETLEGIVTGHTTQIGTLETKVSALETWKTTVDTALGDLKDRLDILEPKVDSLCAVVDSLENITDSLGNRIQDIMKLVTSIEIQAVQNPMFGSVYMPTGLQTNILAAYYGKSLNGGQFPCTPGEFDGSQYIWGSQLMTDGEFAVIGDPKNDYYYYSANQTLMNEEDGNAGTIYMTINPANVDFTGTTFSLVNSLDEDSPFKMGAIKPSTERLQFGVTRAAAKNGFYEAPVTLDAADINKVKVEMSDEILDAVKDVFDNLTTPGNINMTKIASAIQDQMDKLKTDALGLKAWSDEEQRGVYSKYGIAGVAMKNPITYSSFKDFNYTTLPGFQTAMNFIETMANKAKGTIKNSVSNIIAQFPTQPTLQKIDLSSYKINPISGSLDPSIITKFRIQMTIVDRLTADDGIVYNLRKHADGEYYMENTAGAYNNVKFLDYNGNSETMDILDQNGNLLTIAVLVEVDLRSEVNDLYNEMLSQLNSKLGDLNNTLDKIEDVNELVEALDDYLKDINKVIAEVNNTVNNISGDIDDIVSQLQSFINSINNKLVGFINNLNDYLQPILIANSTDGARMVSGTKALPTKISSTCTLYMTNRFAEVAAPAFKRHIAVTNVLNLDGTQPSDFKTLANNINNASADLNKVLDGSQISVKASGFQTGYIYELAYSALDYTGKQVTHKYYVTVK